MKKRVAVLGATGSIGRSTLDILRNKRDRFEPVLFTARKNAKELHKLKEEFPGAFIALEDELLDAIAAAKADITVNGISGAAGLLPSAAVIKAGSDLALANKETVVMAGHIIFDLARENNVRIIPVDSEHSAIFSLIEAHGKENVSEIILTASGGPFLKYSMEELMAVTPQEALAHPTWNMGPKITVDSASLANKGLEVIEAAFLFGLPPEKIKVTVHPQSIVHSMIRLKNGAVYGQMSKPDMRLPIHDALESTEGTEEDKQKNSNSMYGELEFDNLSLTFEKPDTERFPMLELAYKALKGGTTHGHIGTTHSYNGTRLPIIYNAANEIAVEAFLEGKIGFLEIPRIVGYLFNKSFEFEDGEESETIETVLARDKRVREMALEIIRNGSCQC